MSKKSSRFMRKTKIAVSRTASAGGASFLIGTGAAVAKEFVKNKDGAAYKTLDRVDQTASHYASARVVTALVTGAKRLGPVQRSALAAAGRTALKIGTRAIPVVGGALLAADLAKIAYGAYHKRREQAQAKQIQAAAARDGTVTSVGSQALVAGHYRTNPDGTVTFVKEHMRTLPPRKDHWGGSR